MNVDINSAMLNYNDDDGGCYYNANLMEYFYWQITSLFRMK